MEEKPIQVRSIPVDLWREVKMLAVEQDITVRELVIKALSDYMTAHVEKK